MFNAIIERQKKEREERKGEWLVDKHTAELVIFVAAEADGTAAFTMEDMEAVVRIPASLAERMIKIAQQNATDSTSVSETDAKKPSPSSQATTNSTASLN